MKVVALTSPEPFAAQIKAFPTAHLRAAIDGQLDRLNDVRAGRPSPDSEATIRAWLSAFASELATRTD